MAIFDTSPQWTNEIWAWRSRQSPSRNWLTGHILSLVGAGNSPPLKGHRGPCSGASYFLTSSQVQRLVSRQSSEVGLTKGNLKVPPYHRPLRNKACARKYSQSSREWQIQTRQPPRRVDSLVQRSGHSSPGGVSNSTSVWEEPEKIDVRHGWGSDCCVNQSPA